MPFVRRLRQQQVLLHHRGQPEHATVRVSAHASAHESGSIPTHMRPLLGHGVLLAPLQPRALPR